jgi:hypothetical protein
MLFAAVVCFMVAASGDAPNDKLDGSLWWAGAGVICLLVWWL